MIHKEISDIQNKEGGLRLIESKLLTSHECHKHVLTSLPTLKYTPEGYRSFPSALFVHTV